MLIVDQLRKRDPALRIVGLAMLAGLGILLAGFWYFQVFSFGRYLESQQAQSIRRVRFPALRGSIVDRNGSVLAENRPSYNLNLYLEELSPAFKDEYRRQVVRYLGPPQPRAGWWAQIFHRASIPARPKLTRAVQETLGRQARFQVVSNVVQQLAVLVKQPLGLDEGRLLEHYTNRLALPLPLLENLTDAQLALFYEQPAKPPGLNLDVQPLRYYPQGSLAAHILGQLRRVESVEEEEEVGFYYCLPDYQGTVGLEAAFDTELRGRAGFKSVLVNNMGYRQSETIWSPAEPGHSLVLTLDLRLQRAAEQALHSVGPAAKGAVVVLDPRNGDLLALASSPTYDPNLFVPRITYENYHKLSDTNLNATLNRATFGSYQPGSIFKMVVALAALESGDLSPTEIFHSPGIIRFGHRTRSIEDLAPAGDYDFRRAFKLSSNSYFAHYGMKSGLDNLIRMGQQFYLGQRVNVPLLQEISGFFPTPKWLQYKTENDGPLQPGEVANLCIGQGYITVTPLQIALLTATIANGGTIYWPRLVDRIEARENFETRLLRQFPPGQVRGRLQVQELHLQLLREAMLADVEDADGTGRHAAVAGMRICGKTGTAEVTHNNIKDRKDTWFVSFAPYESPKYVVVVLVEGGGSGGGTCAPLARAVYQAIRQVESPPPPSPPALAQQRNI